MDEVHCSEVLKCKPWAFSHSRTKHTSNKPPTHRVRPFLVHQHRLPDVPLTPKRTPMESINRPVFSLYIYYIATDDDN